MTTIATAMYVSSDMERSNLYHLKWHSHVLLVSKEDKINNRIIVSITRLKWCSRFWTNRRVSLELLSCILVLLFPELLTPAYVIDYNILFIKSETKQWSSLAAGLFNHLLVPYFTDNLWGKCLSSVTLTVIVSCLCKFSDSACHKHNNVPHS